MKNVQLLKFTFLSLLLFFYFNLISARDPAAYTTRINLTGFINGLVPYDVDIYVNGKLATDITNVGHNYDVHTEEFPSKIELKYSNDPLNGVNVGDIIKISNHILTKTALDQPNKLLAGDVNNDQKISVSDIVQLRKLILGKTEGFNPDRSWVFIDASYNLQLHNWAEADQSVNLVPGDELVANFKAIKLGDVDLNAKGH